jgi:hypothetical protein
MKTDHFSLVIENKSEHLTAVNFNFLQKVPTLPWEEEAATGEFVVLYIYGRSSVHLL